LQLITVAFPLTSAKIADDVIAALTVKRIAMNDVLDKIYENRGNYLHYKGYIGSVRFSETDAVLHGKAVGINSPYLF
jgi:hypothetical protein